MIAVPPELAGAVMLARRHLACLLPLLLAATALRAADVPVADVPVADVPVTDVPVAAGASAPDEADLPPAGDEDSPHPDAVLPLEDLRAFAEVFDRIRSAYVEVVDDRDLLESAIEGMLDRLDPHSSYLAREDFANLQEATSGEFGGIGIEVGYEDGLVKVISPIDASPAARAGVRPGDVIVRVDDQPLEGKRLPDAVETIRGRPGTGVNITIRRQGEEELLEFDLVRDVIEIASVDERMLEPGFGYVRIAQFQENTGADLLAALRRLRETAGGALDGLVLDLRNNPGGVLRSSVQVADAFLDAGAIVYTEGRLPGSQLSYDATRDAGAEDVPLVVLVNEGSASAAEIVAGALQDHRRAVIMGTPTFGKGSVQSVLPLSGERAIKLTTALYFTPEGRSIQAHGIVPDITVERASVQRAEPRRTVREKDLPGHLVQPNAEDDAEAPTSALTSEDYQLAEALNLLKGLHLLGMRETARD